MNDAIAIKCHAGRVDPVFKLAEMANNPHWRPADTGQKDEDGYTRDWCWRTCSYCGSMHPADLLKFLLAGARLESADWKYGWPHKFYVNEIPNPWGGQDAQIGSNSEPDGKGGSLRTPIMGKLSMTLTGKFYSTHLGDLSADDLAEVGALIFKKTRIEFSLDPEKGLGYRRVPGVPPVSP